MEPQHNSSSGNSSDIESASSSSSGDLRLYFKEEWGRWMVDILPQRGLPVRKSFKRHKDAKKFADEQVDQPLVQ